jgi:peptidoglycan hydrolase-like protein with peptidoglycan-binding domain
MFSFLFCLRGLRAALRLTLLLAAATGIAFAGDVTPATPTPAKTSTAATTSTTAKKTAAKRSAARRPRPQPVQMAPTPGRISEIQVALATSGSYRGDPTGKLDAGTIDGLTQFQSSHGLPPTGKIDALTLEKLGLGAPTAGRGAPLPVPSAPKAPDQAPQTP